MAQAPVHPQLGELLLHAVLRQTVAQPREIHAVERLVLIEAGEHHRLRARLGVLVQLQALRANLFHHALHRGIDAADGVMTGFQIWLQYGASRVCDGSHHAIGADGDHSVHVAERNRLRPEIAPSIGENRFDDVADEGAVLRPRGCEARRFVRAPYDHVGRALDLLHLITVDQFFITREVNHLRSVGAQRLADGKEHRVAEPAARQQRRFKRRRLGGRARGSHQNHRLARLEQRAQIRRTAHFENDGGEQAALTIDGCAGEGEALHGERGGVDGRRQRFVILQPVKLARLERPRSHGGLDDDFDDGRRQADDVVNDGAKFAVELVDERGGRRPFRSVARESAGDDGVALLGPAHRLHHVAGEGWMQIAEKADGAAVGAERGEHADGGGLGELLRLHRMAVFVHRLEITAVDENVRRVFALQHGVRLRARGHQDRARWNAHRLAIGGNFANGFIETVLDSVQRGGVAARVHFHPLRRNAFGETDALLQCERDFFVVQRVAWRID